MSQCISPDPEDTFMRKFEKNEPYYAAQWMLGRLIPEELHKKILLSVYIRKMKHQRAWCWAYEKAPLEYTIVIDSQIGRRESLRAIAHECHHVMQYATGKMRDMWGQHRGKVKWKNQMLVDTDQGSAYYNLPWEKEAYAGQEKLLEAYLRHVKKLIAD